MTRMNGVSSDIVETLRKKNSSKINIYSRKDFCSEYLGQSSLKTSEALAKGIGGIIMIEDAFSILNPSPNSPYDREILISLKSFISEHGNKCIIGLMGCNLKIDNGESFIVRGDGIAWL